MYTEEERKRVFQTYTKRMADFDELLPKEDQAHLDSIRAEK